jgi:cytochrome c-type biogenesis protein
MLFEISNIGILTAFAAGAVSFLSPCVLPLVPGYISYVAGSAEPAGPVSSRRLFPTFLLSICFVLGFSTIFIALGASATGLSHLLLFYRYEASIIGGSIIILFGLLTTQLVRIPWLQREFRIHGPIKGGGPIAAYTLGLAFGFGWTPCIGPVLGAILTVSAVSATSSNGVALLGIYSLGLGLPFLLSALFMDRLTTSLKSVRWTGRLLQLGAGGVMVVMGAAMITGRLSDFSFWLLDQFPILTKIG